MKERKHAKGGGTLSALHCLSPQSFPLAPVRFNDDQIKRSL